MNVDQTVWVIHTPKGKKVEKLCRATVKEIHGPIVRLSVWTGSAFENKNEMIAKIKLTKPE